jgi:hypothetical protein
MTLRKRFWLGLTVFWTLLAAYFGWTLLRDGLDFVGGLETLSAALAAVLCFIGWSQVPRTPA